MIKKWHLKAVVQKSISLLPYNTRIHYGLQRLMGSVDLSEQVFTFKITHARDHIANFKESRPIDKGLFALELGTGWYPVVPIAFYLMGFDRFISVDMHNWLTVKSIFRTIWKFEEWQERGQLDKFLPDMDPERWENLRSLKHMDPDTPLSEVCRKINFSPELKDARQLTFIDDASVDIICSNNTYEHIDPAILKGILLEFKRIIKPDGIMSHHIDMGDHFANFDSSIDKYNFLRFSDKTWGLIDNPLGYQNRLRFRDYKELYRSVDLPFEEKLVLPGRPETIIKEKIAPRFKTYSAEDLAIVGGYLVTPPQT